MVPHGNAVHVYMRACSMLHTDSTIVNTIWYTACHLRVKRGNEASATNACVRITGL